jgi:hypothetical protein
MLGFSWLAFRQAREALKAGRLEEAHRLLCQPCTIGHKRSWEMLREVTRGLVARARHHLEQGDLSAAWNELVAAEHVDGSQTDVCEVRHLLIQRGIEQARNFLQAGEPARAAEILTQLRNRSAEHPELSGLEDAARGWMQAREQAARGEFASAIAAVERVRRVFPTRIGALEQFIKTLEHRHQTFSSLLVQLHQAVDHKDWREVLRLAEQVLATAPQHAEGRRARAHAWKAIEPETMGYQGPKTDAEEMQPARADDKQRFFLWIDGVGGYLVCLGSRVTIGQATPDTFVDIPLFADVSRMHASLVRDSEGYVLEATRPLQVNGTQADRTLLQNGDRITLGSSCQLVFGQPVPVSSSARIDVASGHRLPLAVDGVLLMADTLVIGPDSQAHVTVPDLQQPIVLFRQRDGLAMRAAGEFSVDGERSYERASLRPTSSVIGDDFAFALEPAGTGSGRT